MKIEPEKFDRAETVIREEVEKKDYSESRNTSGDSYQSESSEFYFEIDPEVLVDEGLKEAFEWLKERRGVEISDRKRRVTAECYSMTLQEFFQQKKLRPWQGSLIMTAVIAIDILRQSRGADNDKD